MVRRSAILVRMLVVLQWLGRGCSHRHALALAHASGGGKCKGWVPSPKGAEGGLHKRSAEDRGGPCAR